MIEKKKTKKTKDVPQAQGIRLTDRQFKALLISNFLIGLMSAGQVTTKVEVLAKIPDYTEVTECVLEDCILDPVK